MVGSLVKVLGSVLSVKNRQVLGPVLGLEPESLLTSLPKIAVCKAVFRLSISCSLLEISAIKL